MDFKEIQEERFLVAEHNFEKMLEIARGKVTEAAISSLNEERFNFLSNVKDEEINFIVLPDYGWVVKLVITEKIKRKILWFTLVKSRDYDLGRVLYVESGTPYGGFQFPDCNKNMFFFFQNIYCKNHKILSVVEKKYM